MGTGFLIDTSAAIKYLNESFPAMALDFMDGLDVFQLSFMTRVELLAWKTSDVHAYQQAVDLVDSAVVYGLSEEIILATIRVRRDYRLKLPDAFIAATALVLDATLVADNDRDFLKIPGLKYLNPTRFA